MLDATEHRVAVLVPCDDSVRVMRCCRLTEWSRRGATGRTKSPTTAMFVECRTTAGTRGIARVRTAIVGDVVRPYQRKSHTGIEIMM